MSITRIVADFVWAGATAWALAKSLPPPKRQSVCTAPWAIAVGAVLSGAIYAVLDAW